MKGVSYITSEKNIKKAVVIELSMLEKKSEEIHDLIDILVAEARRDDEVIGWEQAKQHLKNKGKL